MPENQIEGMAAISSAILPAAIFHAGKSSGGDGAISPAALPVTVFLYRKENKMNLSGSMIVYIGERQKIRIDFWYGQQPGIAFMDAGKPDVKIGGQF